jgi:hypothetical protein
LLEHLFQDEGHLPDAHLVVLVFEFYKFGGHSQLVGFADVYGASAEDQSERWQ